SMSFPWSPFCSNPCGRVMTSSFSSLLSVVCSFCSLPVVFTGAVSLSCGMLKRSPASHADRVKKMVAPKVSNVVFLNTISHSLYKILHYMMKSFRFYTYRPIFSHTNGLNSNINIFLIGLIAHGVIVPHMYVKG